MFDMFDYIKRGWLIKLIEAVEAVEEDAIDAIVEEEDGIAVEAIYSVGAICGSDTMKKQVWLHKPLYLAQSYMEWTMREEKEVKKRK